MENETQTTNENELTQNQFQPQLQQPKSNLHYSIIIAALILGGSYIYTQKSPALNNTQTTALGAEHNNASEISDPDQEIVIPSAGVELPVKWGDLGAKMVSVGVIDAEQLEKIYANRGGLSEADKKLLYGSDNGNLKITPENSGFVLNLLWALGLGSKNEILTNGEMADKQYGGAGNFASTGGWTIAKGKAMDHYSKHKFFDLTPEQQALVDKVSQNIYRPCCGNSTHFPDCNHGMAMLGLMELMASQGASEAEMYKTALAVNSYWFPENYLNIYKFLKQNKIDWNATEPQKILGDILSSGQGYKQMMSKLATPTNAQGGGGCGVDSGAPVSAPKKQSGGCGI